MSSVVISGNTSGTITLDAPAVAGTTTLTLPATSGTVVTKDTNGITSVNGVQFPATQSASADANCLDDYEEGTFTPTISGNSSPGTGTYTVRNGFYTKVGNVVTFAWNTRISSHTGTGNFALTGLPFASGKNAVDYFPVLVFSYALAYTANNILSGFIPGGGATYIVFEQIPTGGGTTTGIPLDTSCELYITGSYFTS